MIVIIENLKCLTLQRKRWVELTKKSISAKVFVSFFQVEGFWLGYNNNLAKE